MTCFGFLRGVASSLAGVALCVAGGARSVYAQDGNHRTELTDRPAAIVSWASNATMLGSARAGQRIVAAGDHGVILLSDDEGKTFRQARVVPTRATLTSVYFVGDKEGWAVGHWGVILHTSDGGETWEIQRRDVTADSPLFSVSFDDKSQGVAVGLWGLVLHTQDGGRTWKPVDLPPAPNGKKFNKNLFALFRGSGKTIFVAAERGTVLKSGDGGKTWEIIDTGNLGSYWTGLKTKEGAILVAGLRGRMFRSDQDEKKWIEISTGTKSSITSMVQLADGTLVAVGLDGLMLKSSDSGQNWESKNSGSRAAFTAVIATSRGSPLIFGEDGPLLGK